MTIVALADLHGSDRFLDAARAELAHADVVLLVGDITNFGGRSEAGAIIGRALEINPNVLAVSGNCDYPDVAQLLDEKGLNIDGARRSVGALSFVGLGGSLPGPGKTPNIHTEEELADALDRGARKLEGAFVLVSHQPPFDTRADLALGIRHVGSTAVRNFILRTAPLVCFTGHIHESICVDSLGTTQVVNAGPFKQGKLARAVIQGDGSAEISLVQL